MSRRVNVLQGRRIDGAALTAARLRAGLSQYQLAERAGCSRVHITTAENGRAGMSPALLAAVCAALGVTIESVTQPL